MSEETKPKAALGRNQKIAIAFLALPLLLTFGLVLAIVLRNPGAATAAVETWAGWITPYTLGGLGILLGVSGGIKAAQAIAGKPKA